MKAEPKRVKHYFFIGNEEKVFDCEYVIIPMLPEDQQKPFDDFIAYNDREYLHVPEETYYQFDCAFYKDYEEWYEKTFAN